MPLSFIESRRVAVVIEDAIEKLTFLESISPDVLQHRDELSKFVGDEISRIISVQRQLEQRYECLIAQREGLKGSTNRSKYKNIQSEIQEVSRALRDSTKDLCRNLKDSPNIAGNLIKIQQERLNLIESLRTTLSEVTVSHQISFICLY
jgi:Mg2+ and Co2+ transporter CorA|tara:strand:+ start:619 stop:1065 length:447 start_codon:yes stop_codon:yes gene_type:complete